MGAELRSRIWSAYSALTKMLIKLGVETSKEKIVPPTTRLEFLGITFDSESMIMGISMEKVQDIVQELATWTYRTNAHRQEVESLIGKLQFLAKCVRPGRIFLSRLIQWIKGMDRSHMYPIPLEARKDIAWWARFIQQYNGVSLLWLIKQPGMDTIIKTDACKRGYGGICGDQYFRGRFPKEVQSNNIAILEMWAVMVALKIWAPQLQGKYFWIHVDNKAVATVLNSGGSRETELQNSLREIALITANHQFVIKARHIPRVQNRILDWLFRWSDPKSKQAFCEFAHDSSLKHIRINNSWLQYKHNW